MILNIGVFQYKMRDETPLKKINRLENHLKNNTTLDLIVCPELFLSGYGSSVANWYCWKHAIETKKGS